MTSMDCTIVGSYNYPVAALPVCISVLASYAALDLAERITASYGLVRRQVWLISGAVVLGIGIWSMHYTAMWAFRILCLAHRRSWTPQMQEPCGFVVNARPRKLILQITGTKELRVTDPKHLSSPSSAWQNSTPWWCRTRPRLPEFSSVLTVDA